MLIDFGNTKNTIIVAGSGRSGTTWLGDILNYKNNYRVLFEPFHKQKTKEWNVPYLRTYLNPEKEYPEYANKIKTILSGKVSNE